MRRLNLDQRPLDTIRARGLLALLILLPTSGCMHRPGTVVETYHLQDVASYPLLVPSHASSPSGRDFATTPVDLGASGHDLPSTCFADGPVFSLRPPDKTASALWLVRSPSVREWEAQGGQIDAVAEWTQFSQKLQSLQKQGCFAPGSTLTRTLQSIAESIPIPASELLLFFYSYNGTGAVDLIPGMQIRVEHGVLQGREGDRTMKSIEAQYEVVASSASGVTLHLSRTENRQLSRETGVEEKNMFNLVRLTQKSTMLRLFLQARTDKGVERKPILLLSNNIEGLDQATRRIDASASDQCAAVNVNETSCIYFTKSAVSLMISCSINGKLSYKPLGTTVSQVINDSRPALDSLVLTRKRMSGGYAEISFPRTLEAAGQVMIINGDRLSW